MTAHTLSGLIGVAILTGIAALVLRWLRSLDPGGREPPGWLLATFVAGALASLVALTVEIARDAALHFLAADMNRNILLDYLGAGLIAEGAKLAALLTVAYPRFRRDRLYAGLLYGTAAGLGFGVSTVAMDIWEVPMVMERAFNAPESVLRVDASQSIMWPVLHGMWGTIMGFFLVRVKFRTGTKRLVWLAWAYLLPVLLHGFITYLNMVRHTQFDYRVSFFSTTIPHPFGLLPCSLLGLSMVLAWVLLELSRQRPDGSLEPLVDLTPPPAPVMEQSCRFCASCGRFTPHEAGLCTECGLEWRFVPSA